MKIETLTYLITFEDGEIYYLERIIQKDKTILWKIIEDPTGFCLGADLKWHHEVFPSSKTDEYLKNTRFKYDEAINIIISFRATQNHNK